MGISSSKEMCWGVSMAVVNAFSGKYKVFVGRI